MAERVSPQIVKTPETKEKTPLTLKVKLKSNYPEKDKDGKIIGTLKPDTIVVLPYQEAMKLINKAFAVKA